MVAVSVDVVAPERLPGRSRQKGPGHVTSWAGMPDWPLFFYLGSAQPGDRLARHDVLAAVRIKVKVIRRMIMEPLTRTITTVIFTAALFYLAFPQEASRGQREGTQHYPASIADSRFCPGIYLPLQPFQGKNQSLVYKKAITVD